MSNTKHSGKLTNKTFKQTAQERLLKATVIPASELAKQKQEILDRAEALTRAAIDEEFLNQTEESVSPSFPSPISQKVEIVTKETHEEQL